MDSSPDLTGHSLAVLISILNRVVDDAVMAALATKYGDVSRAHGAVFEMLDPGGSRVAAMARRARMTRQAMGELVEDLERLGYLERQPDPSDGRAKLVFLTAKGETALSVGIAAVVDLEARWEGSLGVESARAFRQALETLVAEFGREHVRQRAGPSASLENNHGLDPASRRRQAVHLATRPRRESGTRRAT